MIGALLLMASAPVSVPSRIVSNNPCIDAILAEVAAPAQIAAISHYSNNPRATSVDLKWARRFRTIGDTAEEVLMMHPDLFLTGIPAPTATTWAVKRANIRTVSVGVANTIAENQAQIMTIAEAVGNRAAGVKLVARIDAAVRDARATTKIPALIWQGGGLVPGQDSLASEMLKLSGFRNMGAAYGLVGWGTLPLEPVIMNPPRVVLSSGGNERDMVQRHSALARLKGRTTLADFPEDMLFCGGPTIIRAMARLKQIRMGL
ncbi:ABC transporter substrate-binding protein [Sphingomonas paeninsulae]|jgi:iron complex transport system substrate-binding protein|uniref:ABC transporter substrate-binding protein n=1 Tax=Sphingomonas paeninsulae TaxID=2319844 RepID=A0A494TGD2_SPHPE|nr:ABC transporter substrate-binding protein [Sphingomonas paeninsulae]AYJ85993.1 ABC transporter substrate-binding protein [Sphingomonas paeninsulae]